MMKPSPKGDFKDLNYLYLAPFRGLGGAVSDLNPRYTPLKQTDSLN
jgi:hypothetical protein